MHAKASLSEKARAFFLALRPWSFSMSFSCFFLGIAIAFESAKSVNFLLSLIALFGILLLHASANLINDYFDFKHGIDKELRDELKLIGMENVFYFSLAFLFLALLIAWYISKFSGGFSFYLAILGAFLAISYTAYPLNYKYLALGELGVFLAFSALTYGAFYINALEHSFKAAFLAFNNAFLISATLLANNIRDVEEDKQSEIKTLPMIIGEEKAIFIYRTILALPYTLLALSIAAKALTPLSFIAFLTLPRAVKLMRKSEKSELRNADKENAKLSFNFAMLLASSLVLSVFLR